MKRAPREYAPGAFTALLGLILVAAFAEIQGKVFSRFDFSEFTLEVAANTFAFTVAIAAIVLFGGQLLLAPVRSALQWLIERFFRPIGLGSIPPSQTRDRLVEGIRAQEGWIAQYAAWPRRDANARPARGPANVQFGDAQFSTSLEARNAVRAFLSRPKPKNGADRLEDALLTITGEPGAGKSVFTQEIHHSLAQGLREGHHSLVPIVIFASALTKDILAAGSLQDILSRYFHTRDDAGADRLAEFIDVAWQDHDFLIIVDGLDEIPQRAAYQAYQEELRDEFTRELERAGARSRRFIVTCRIDDDLKILSRSPIILRGLRTERERRRFCENLISQRDPNTRQALRRALSAGTGHLASPDVFRRNPYFLKLLIDYFVKRGGRPINPHIDFPYLIRDFIERETDRDSGDGRRRKQREGLRKELERVATFPLPAIAYAMTTASSHTSLYGKATIDAAFIDQFVGQLRSALAGKAGGAWLATARMVERLASGRPLTNAEVSEVASADGLAEQDALVLSAAATSNAGEWRDRIMDAIGTITLNSHVRDPDWYGGFGEALAEASRHLKEPFDRVAVLALSRGLAAAHALLLVYVDKEEHTFALRFRHRRLAEFFAATFYTEQWDDIAPVQGSIWLAPVLNLVCAMEREAAPGFAWLVRQLEITPPGDWAWRTQMFATVEAAAFTGRAAPQLDLLVRLAQTMLHNLNASAGGRSDQSAVTRFAIIQCLQTMSDLNIRLPSSAAPMLPSFERIENTRPAHDVVATGKSIRAVERLTGRGRSIGFRLGSFGKALVEPYAVAGSPNDTFNSGMAGEWSLAVLAMFAGELLFALLASGMVTLLGRFSVPNSPELVDALAFSTGACVAVIRGYIWQRSPSAAEWIAAFPARSVYFLVVGPAYVFSWLAANIAKLPYQLWRALNALVRWLSGVPRKLPSLAFKALQVLWLPATVVAAVMGFAILILLVMQDASSPPSDPGGPVVVAGRALPVAVEESERLPSPISRTADALEPPAPDCEELAETAHGLGERTWLDASPTADEVEAARREYSAEIDSIRRSNVDANCRFRSDGAWYRAEDYAALEVIRSTPSLMPISDEKPTFDRSDATAFEEAIANARSATSESNGLLIWLDGALAASDLKAAIRQLNEARLAGRVSFNVDGQYEAPGEYATLAIEVQGMSASADAALHALADVQVRRTPLMLSELANLIVVIPSIVVVLALGMAWHAGRRDKRMLASLKELSFDELLHDIRTYRMSDPVRSGVLAILLEKPQVDDADVAKLEEVANNLLQDDSARERSFGLKLSEVTAGLANRLAHRTA